MIESIRGLAILLLEGLAVCVVAVIGYGVYALTHPMRRTYAHAVSRGRPGHPGEVRAGAGEPLAFDSWTFRTRGLDLPVWDVTGGAPDGPVIVMSHGWGDSRVGALTRLPALLPLASRLVMWDMPGHGEAPGRSTLGTREVDDLLALIDRVRQGGADVVLYGWSLGAGVSLCAAARDEPDAPASDGARDGPARVNEPSLAGRGRIEAVIAEAPYRLPWTPARNVMRARGLPWRWNIAPIFAILGLDVGVGPRWGGFDRAGHAARLACPLLVLHGTEDVICPVEDGRAIARAAARGEIAEIAGGRHMGLWTEEATRGECERVVRGFLGRVRSS